MRRFGTRRGGAGFSLIELLIVVAIIAALVGVAVPFFQDNLAETQRAKALQDLQIIQKAIVQYEQEKNRLLLGTTLEPLVGGYLQQLPVDPWGNRYLWDGGVGFLGSYGADALPGGNGPDADIIARSLDYGGEKFPVKPIFPRRVQYRGPWGPPRPPLVNGVPDFGKFHEGNSFVITFTRGVVEARDWNLPTNCIYMWSVAGTMMSTDMSGESFPPNTWKSAAHWEYALGPGIDPLHRPKEGVIVLRCNVDTMAPAIRAAYPDALPIRPDARFSFHDSTDISYAPGPFETTHTPAVDPASPLDPQVYGPAALEYLPKVMGPPVTADPSSRGLRIEKY